MPDVELEPGNMPEYDVEVADVDVETETDTVIFNRPDLNVEMPEDDGMDVVVFEIDNTAQPSASIRTRLVEVDGDRAEILGPIGPNDDAEFTGSPMASADMMYRLVAETGAGDSYTSEPFSLYEVEEVEWDVGQNTLEIDD